MIFEFIDLRIILLAVDELDNIVIFVISAALFDATSCFTLNRSSCLKSVVVASAKMFTLQYFWS